VRWDEAKGVSGVQLASPARTGFSGRAYVGVDPELRVSFWDYFAALKERETTVIITTHYMDEAHRCGRIGLLREGKLIAEGTPQEITALMGEESLEDAFLVLARKNER
jgi:ABC-2 type transport system ATP-binding protein